MPVESLRDLRTWDLERTRHSGLLAVDGNETMRALGAAGCDLSCARCGYGVATGPPSRCPMCNGETEWLVRRRVR